MDKKELRLNMTTQRQQLPVEEQKELSLLICKQVIESMAYKECQHICVYQAFRGEVSCEVLMKMAFQDAKRVYVPVVDNHSKTMEFYEITKDTVWVQGAYGIEEPVLSEYTARLREKALIIMPGLIFDRKKHRIGYGGGYYDKYLELHKEHNTMALCYDFQILEEEIPYEEHDILPDYIVTNKEIIM